MSSYTLSGQGVQTLTAGTTALHVHIVTYPVGYGSGSANPASLYQIGLLRAGDGTGWWRTWPIDAADAWFGLFTGVDRIGYSLDGAGVVTVTEVIGGSFPFQGPSGATGATGATGPAGPSGSTEIASVVTSGSQSTVAFSSIPSTYKHLRIMVLARGTQSATSVTARIQMNSDTGANYDSSVAYTGGVTVNATQSLGATSGMIGDIPAATGPTSQAGVIVVDIPNYTNAAWFKAYVTKNSARIASSSGNMYSESYGGAWRSTAAITALTLLLSAGAFADGSLVSLYGIG